MSIYLRAIEYAFPEKIITNEQLQQKHPDWQIEKTYAKTGVLMRHEAEKNETALDIAIGACDKLFKKYDRDEIDTIIFCTQSPDYIMPPNSYLIHSHYSFSKKTKTFDINQACSGYIYSLWLSDSLIKSGASKNILLINSDTYSKYINPKDRATKTIFGDGAAVTLISGTEKLTKYPLFQIETSGKDHKYFYIPGGAARNPYEHCDKALVNDGNNNYTNELNIKMNGFGVLSFFKSAVPKQIKELLNENDMQINDIDLFVFHQASKIALQSVALGLKTDFSKVYSNINKVGNLVSASIPVAIKMADEENKLKRGQIIALSGFGVGLSWGTCVLEY